MNDYISKPIRDYDLHTLINKYSVAAFSSNQVANNKVTNLNYVNELANGNTEFVSRMIDLFVTENILEVTRLENAIKEADYNAICKTAHKIKSNISFAGLDAAVINELNEIESLSSENENLPRIAELFIIVKEVCIKAIDELTPAKTGQD